MVKILILDIETSLMEGYFFQPKTEYIRYEQVKKDWFVLSWAAKWRGSKEVFYEDQRHRRDVSNDKPLLKGIWKLLDEADIIITKNGKRFDKKKLWARFAINGMGKPSSFQHIDVEKIMRSEFGFTYNSLEYAADNLCTKYKKLKSRVFQGIDLWIQCANKNQKAFQEMEKYNKHDVLATEELFEVLSPWKESVNFSLYYPDEANVCICGSREFIKKGYALTETGRYQRYRCKNCKQERRGKDNTLSKEKRASMLKKVKL
jgi:hypothetical protein